MEKIKPLIESGEELLITFYGFYTSRGYQFGGKPNLNGTWAMTDKRLLFTGKAGFSSGWSGYGKAGKIMTIPYSQIVEMIHKKNKIYINHTAEHEGRPEGKVRRIILAPHRLKRVPETGKKESKQDYIARAEMIYNKIKELAGG